MTGLAVPVPAQVSPGNFLTAALWNATVYNGITFLLNPPICHTYQTTVQSVANSTWTSISCNVTTLDTYGGHSDTVNNSRYTAQVAGYYDVCGNVVFGPNGTGFRASRLAVNGTALNATQSFSNNIGAGLAVTCVTPWRTVFMNAGDYVEMQGYQTSGGALSTYSSADLASGLNVRWSHA